MKTVIRPEAEMKDSGIQYLGKIPVSWRRCRLKNICHSFNSNITTSILNGENGDFKIFGASGLIGFINFETMKKEYLGIVKDGAGVGRINSYPPHSSLLGTLAYIVPNNGINIKWVKYVIDNMNLGESVDKTTIPHIYFSTYGNNYIPLPSMEEQQAIADYLDEKCTKIDEIIYESKASIDEYKELKESVIFEVVTKGLGSSNDVCFKTDIEWTDGVCSSWDISQIRYLYELRKEVNKKPLDEVNLISLYTDKGVLQHSDIEKTSGNKAVTAEGYKIVYPNDIVVNIILCWMGAMGRSDYYGVTSPAYDIYKPVNEKKVSSRYYHYLFRTDRFSKKCYTVGRGIMMMRWRTYSSEFKSIKVPVPPKKEQEEIADFLDKKTLEIDSLISEKQSLIKDLEAYKKSLIYEVVTGKRRVV